MKAESLEFGSDEITAGEKAQLFEGMERRLSTYGKRYVAKLAEHMKIVLRDHRGAHNRTIAENWNEIFELCKEGTEEGRHISGEGVRPGVILHTHIKNSPEVASRNEVDALQFIINHDRLDKHPSLSADSIITIDELIKILDEYVKG